MCCESIKEVLKYHVYNSNIVRIMGTLLLCIFISLYVNFASLKHSLFSFFVGVFHRDYQFLELLVFILRYTLETRVFTVFEFSPVD